MEPNSEIEYEVTNPLLKRYVSISGENWQNYTVEVNIPLDINKFNDEIEVQNYISKYVSDTTLKIKVLEPVTRQEENYEQPIIVTEGDWTEEYIKQVFIQRELFKQQILDEMKRLEELESQAQVAEEEEVVVVYKDVEVEVESISRDG